MKRIVIAMALLVGIFSACLAHSIYLSGFIRDLTVTLEQAEAKAEQEDWTGAKDLTQQAAEKWQKNSTYLHILLRHSDTDQVYTGFGEVKEFIQCQEGGEYSAANARLIAQLTLLAEAEQLTLKNVL